MIIWVCRKNCRAIQQNLHPISMSYGKELTEAVPQRILRQCCSSIIFILPAGRRDETAFNAYISRMKNMIKPLRANPQVIFPDTLSKIVTMNSPREIAIPTEAQFDQVNLDRLLEIYRDRFADAGDFTYVMVGNFKTEEVITASREIYRRTSFNRKKGNMEGCDP